MQSYDVTTKEQVIGAWTAGASLNELVSRFSVPKSTIRGWLEGRTRTPPAPKTEELSEENIEQFAWNELRHGDSATSAILLAITDSVWIKSQNARDLAILLGTLSDKRIRLLAAYQQRGSENDASGADDAGEPGRPRPALPAGEVHPPEAHTPT